MAEKDESVLWCHCWILGSLNYDTGPEEMADICGPLSRNMLLLYFISNNHNVVIYSRTKIVMNRIVLGIYL